MESELVAMLTMDVTIETSTGTDTHGNLTYAAGETVKGHLDSTETSTGTPGSRDGVEGQEAVSTVTLLVLDAGVDPVPAIGDRVTTEVDDAVYDIDRVTLFYDEGEPHHYEVVLNERL